MGGPPTRRGPLLAPGPGCRVPLDSIIAILGSPRVQDVVFWWKLGLAILGSPRVQDVILWWTLGLAMLSKSRPPPPDLNKQQPAALFLSIYTLEKRSLSIYDYRLPSLSHSGIPSAREACRGQGLVPLGTVAGVARSRAKTTVPIWGDALLLA
jgi:hypothetical protein